MGATGNLRTWSDKTLQLKLGANHGSGTAMMFSGLVWEDAKLHRQRVCGIWPHAASLELQNLPDERASLAQVIHLHKRPGPPSQPVNVLISVGV